MTVLALDVGNTVTEIGIFDGERLLDHWRISTRWDRTEDEYLLLFKGLLGTATGLSDGVPRGAVVASVVPPAIGAVRSAVAALVDGPVLIVGPGVKTGMSMAVDHPREVGADRVMNALAARDQYGVPVIVVDFGTATTLDLVGGDGSFRGGAIAPGIEVSMDGLVGATAALRRVELVAPRSVVGRTTIEAMQSGLLFGYAGLVDGIVGRMAAELPEHRVARVATGPLAASIVPLCAEVEIIDEFITLNGLRLVYERTYPAGGAGTVTDP